jgi:hypothetical protein
MQRTSARITADPRKTHVVVGPHSLLYDERDEARTRLRPSDTAHMRMAEGARKAATTVGW